ncbi:MAG: class I SAM-dependent methyltransferase [Nitrospiraceae bacterium]|nr:MAG: class I SAM-dependent methyltransferase [Nitrospiraceae bacterium]
MNDDLEKIRELTASVEGRLVPEEAALLYSLARDGNGEGEIVEIGSFHGYSTIWLASGSQAGKGGRVYAVDPHDTDLHGRNEAIFRENLKKTGVDRYVVPIVRTSSEAAATWERPIRLLWIDGAHDYKSVENDIACWEKHLVEGGTIIFHDAFCIFWPDVGKVIEQYIFNSDRFAGLTCVNTIICAEKVMKVSQQERKEKELFLQSISERVRAVDDYQKVELLLRSGKEHEAAEVLRSCESGINDFVTPAYRMVNLLSIGICYRRAGLHARAEEIFREIRACRTDKNLILKNYRASLELGDLYRLLKRYRDSEDSYKEVMTEDDLPGKIMSRAILGLAKCYFATGRYDEAEDQYRAFLEMEEIADHDRFWALSSLGRCYSARKKHLKAEEQYQKAFSLETIPGGTRVGVAEKLAGCLFEQGKFDVITGVTENVLLLPDVSDDVKIGFVRKVKKRIARIQSV